MHRKPSVHDATFFIDLRKLGQLDLSPPYQRRSVWSVKDRRFFLDTIFNNYPCPPIFLYKTIDLEGKSTYHVIDGKQRLETILLFVDNKIAIDKAFSDERLAGKRWKDLTDNEIKYAFWNYSIPVEYLESMEPSFVNEVFDRFNRNSSKLERQELRHARFNGWFINYVEGEAGTETQSGVDAWRKLGIVTTARSRRMKDVQFLSEIFLICIDRKVVGFDQDYLDDKYGDLETPEETNVNFQEDEIKQDISRVRDYIVAMEQHNGCITTYAKSFGNFYSVWGMIALAEKLPEVEDLADRYSIFMANVQKVASGTIEITDESDPSLIGAQEYQRNIIGAHTEFPQRESRHAALLGILLSN